MKRKGILMICAVLGMTTTVSAFTYRAISANMKSQAINYKGNIINEEVIVYNETTYVPLRNLGKIVGVPVDYKNGTIYLGDTTNSTDLNTSNSIPSNQGNNDSYIGEISAKNIALQHAGVGEKDTTVTKLEMDKENNKVVYEIEFYVGNKEYDYEVDALTGAIISYDYDIEGFEIPSINNNNGKYKGKEVAEQIALTHAKLTKEQVKYIKNELDIDDGRCKYEIEFKYGNKEYEYEIDAYTGEILKFSIDND